LRRAELPARLLSPRGTGTQPSSVSGVLDAHVAMRLALHFLGAFFLFVIATILQLLVVFGDVVLVAITGTVLAVSGWTGHGVSPGFSPKVDRRR